MTDTENDLTPGDLIRQDMAAKGWTQRDLAAVLGVDFSILSRVVTGRLRVTPQRAYALAQATGRNVMEYCEAQNRLDVAKAETGKLKARRKYHTDDTAPIRKAIWAELESALYRWRDQGGDFEDLQNAARVIVIGENAPQGY
jgi:HTH-type transcriptional regulator/antitoxin HigA